ncbi:MAG: methyltransferase domain-containing protein [Clostridiales bacterium]|nr:methyltransferase domain-containing protein [Clostridiales bacterium]
MMEVINCLIRRIYQIQDAIDDFIAEHISPKKYNEYLGIVKFNRILNNSARSEYLSIIEQMNNYVPRMMSRKIPEANVQQAFVLDTVFKFIKNKSKPKILCVGSFDDTAAACLKKMGYCIEEIDPVLNYDLETYFNLPTTHKSSFDVIFSTSVIEHVPDDEKFISQIAELLAPGGIGILTFDYNNEYKPGDKLPQTNLRFYTKKDIIERLFPCAIGCILVDYPQWDDSIPDFMALR